MNTEKQPGPPAGYLQVENLDPYLEGLIKAVNNRCEADEMSVVLRSRLVGVIAYASALERVVGEMLETASDSDGIAGFHLNGAVAQWEEFDWFADAMRIDEVGPRFIMPSPSRKGEL